MTSRRLRRRRSRPLSGLVLLLLALPPLPSQALAKDDLWIRDVTVLPMTGEGALEHRDVRVSKGSIAEIVAHEDSKKRRRGEVLDGSGRYLIPGLIDAHVHVKRSPKDIRRLFDLFLFHGVTTVVNLDGSKALVELRERIAAGDEVGPTVVTSGPIVRGSESTTEEQGRQIVRDHLAVGYDLVKVYNPLSEAGYRGVIDEARKHDLPVIGHAVRAVGIPGALASGQHIAHMEELVYGYFTWKSPRPSDLPADVVERLDLLLDESKLPELARRVKEAGIWVTPNLVAYHGIVEQTEDLDAVLAREEVAWMPNSMQLSWQPKFNGYVNRDNQENFGRSVTRTYPFLEALTLAFQQAGVPLLAGTDVGIPVVVAGTSLHRELELLVDAGLSPEEALSTATRSAGDFLGRDDLGHIAVGARADLVLLSEDPREDIRRTRSIAAVIVGGSLFDREAVARQLEE